MSCSNARVPNIVLSIIPLTFGTEGAQHAVTHSETFTGSRLDQQVGSRFFFLTTSRAFSFTHPILKPNLGNGFCCIAKDFLSSSVLSKCVNIKIDTTNFTCIL